MSGRLCYDTPLSGYLSDDDLTLTSPIDEVCQPAQRTLHVVSITGENDINDGFSLLLDSNWPFRQPVFTRRIPHIVIVGFGVSAHYFLINFIKKVRKYPQKIIITIFTSDTYRNRVKIFDSLIFGGISPITKPTITIFEDLRADFISKSHDPDVLFTLNNMILIDELITSINVYDRYLLSYYNGYEYDGLVLAMGSKPSARYDMHNGPGLVHLYSAYSHRANHSLIACASAFLVVGSSYDAYLTCSMLRERYPTEQITLVMDHDSFCGFQSYDTRNTKLVTDLNAKGVAILSNHRIVTIHQKENSAITYNILVTPIAIADENIFITANAIIFVPELVPNIASLKNPEIFSERGISVRDTMQIQSCRVGRSRIFPFSFAIGSCNDLNPLHRIHDSVSMGISEVEGCAAGKNMRKLLYHAQRPCSKRIRKLKHIKHRHLNDNNLRMRKVNGTVRPYCN
ncbi:hypothetical protein PCE1_002778 [Barthelona sp. PCE]